MKYKVIYIFFLCLFQLQSQNLKISKINSANFPFVSADVIVNDSNGNYLQQLDKKDFLLQENGNFIDFDKFDFKCKNNTGANPLSTILLLDVSSSMKEDNRLSLLQAASFQWFVKMNVANDETAIITFASDPFLSCGFTNDTVKLRETLDTINIDSGTDFNRAFLDSIFGALIVSRKAINKPNIIIITDGIGSLNYNNVAKKAIEQNATVHCITLGLDIPEELQKLVEATSGLYFSNLDKEPDILNAFSSIKAFASYNKPCTLNWTSSGCISDKVVKITYTPFNISSTIKFIGNDSIVPFLEIDNKFKYFTNTDRTAFITITARNADVLVKGISKNKQNFDIQFLDSIPKPSFILKKDKSFKVLASTTKIGDEFTLCTFNIDASTCSGSQFYATYGKSGVTPEVNNIKIIVPNGGEEFPAGSNQIISWFGTLPNQKVKVEVSTNDGRVWMPVLNPLKGNSILWETPAVNSNKCLARVTQLDSSYGKNYLNISTDSIDINCVDWSNDGNKIAAAAQDSTISIYNAISGKLIAKRKYHNAPVRAIKWSPDGIRLISGGEDSVAYIFDTFSNQITDTIKGFNGNINSIDWNNSGNAIAFGCSDSSIYYLKMNGSKTLTKTLVANGELTSLRFNYTDNLIVIGALDSILRVVNTVNFQTVGSFIDLNTINSNTSHNQAIMGVAFNKAGDKIVSCGRGLDRLVKVWSFENSVGKFLYQYQHKSGVLAVDWSWASDLIASCGTDFTVHIWKYDNLNSEDKYIFGSSRNQNSVRFSPDGTRVVVGTEGLNQLEKINLYSIDTFPFQQAVSDSNFSLIKFDFSARNVNFGNVRIGDRKEVNFLKNYFKMNSEGIVKIDSIVPASKLFSVSYGNKFVTKNSQPDLGFYFAPEKIGLIDSTLSVYTNIGKFDYRITGTGVQSDLTINDYNFGKIENFSKKESNIIELKNNLSRKVVVTEINVKQNKSIFKLLENYSNITLESKETKTIRLDFEPVYTQEFGTTLEVLSEGEVYTSKVKGESGEPTLIYPDSVNIGNVVCDLPILYKLKLKNNGNYKFNASNMKFKGNYLNTLISSFEIDAKDSIEILFKLGTFANLSNLDTLCIESTNLKYKELIKIAVNYNYIDKSFSLSTNKVEFKNVEPLLEFTKDIELKNSGTLPISWNFLFPLPIGPYFSIEDIKPNPTLPNSSSTITIKFKGGNKGDVLHFDFPLTQCNNTTSLSFTASVKSEKPQLITDNSANFGDLLCQDSTKEYKLEVNNNGGATLNIVKIELTGQDKNNFTIDDSNPFSLLTGTSKIITIKFKSIIPKQYFANIVLKSNDNTYFSNDSNLVIPINASKLQSDFEILQTALDFKFVGQTNPGILAFEVKNTGTQKINFNQISNLSQFEIVSIDPREILPNQSSTFSILYKGLVPTNLSMDNLIVSDSCGNKKSLKLRVLPADLASFDLTVGKYGANIGEIFEVPVSIANLDKVEATNLKSITVKFGVNRTILQNLETMDDKYELVNNVKFFNEKFEIKKYETSQIGKLKFRCLWGNDSVSAITIKEVKFEGNNNTTIVVNSLDGEVKVNNLCYAGGTRLFLDDEKKLLQLVTNYDNSGVLTIQSQNQIKVDKVILFDILGNVIFSSNNIQFLNGISKLKTPLLINGVYFIEIYSGDNKTNQVVNVTY